MSPQAEHAGPREVLARAQELFLRKDLNAFADMFAEDGTHELPFAPPGVPRLLKGREAIRRYLTSITSTPMVLEGFGDLTVHETADPDVVIAEYVARGTVVSTGKPYSMPYVQLLRVADGEILTWRDYWSPLEGARALGPRGIAAVALGRVRASLRGGRRRT
ncbi:nuclear transport factor 2 family protein [Glycomyces tenuis]|uniref:nuclear transport factor 2 family protein n=1 Tax=Glycomyces tenuis TaxID=58116 RepID=UPI000410CC03|nr:nuclear transport factor 2 family protein [Glycomyces tenuis]